MLMQRICEPDREQDMVTRQLLAQDRIPQGKVASAASGLDTLTLEFVTDATMIEADWRALEQYDCNSLHQGFDWCQAFARANGRPLRALRGSRDGRTMMILPLVIVRARGIRLARFPGGGFNNINTGLFAPDIGGTDAAASAMFKRHLRQALSGHADLLHLDKVPLAWRGARSPLGGLQHIESQNHAFQLTLRDGFDETLSQLNAKSRKRKHRIQTRRLAEIGGFEHVIAKTPAEGHALLDLFFRQKGQRLEAFGLPDVFAPDSVRDFLHRLVDVPAQGTDQPLLLHAIRLTGEHAGHVPAIASLSRKGDHVICQFSSIDDTVCPEASPGELLFWLMIEEACRTKAAIFDFGIGDQAYKRSWCTQETVQYDFVLPISTLGRVMVPATLAVTKAKAAIKRHPAVYKTVQKWRSRRQAK
jgi:CelD/BcsL family acetyltransferase involved in cellulose biosynthesis